MKEWFISGTDEKGDLSIKNLKYTDSSNNFSYNYAVLAWTLLPEIPEWCNKIADWGSDNDEKVRVNPDWYYYDEIMGPSSINKES